MFFSKDIIFVSFFKVRGLFFVYENGFILIPF